MLTKKLENKIAEQRGASLPIALFALIVIIIIATVILGSALANIGRVRRNQQAEQNYLTESSAVELMGEFLDGVSINYKTTKTTTTKSGGWGGSPSTDNDSSGPDFDATIKANNPFETDLTNWFKPNTGDVGSGIINNDYYIQLDDVSNLEGKIKVYDVVAHAVLPSIDFENMAIETSDDDGNDVKRQDTVLLTLYFTLVDSSNNGKAISPAYHMTMKQEFECIYQYTYTKTTSSGWFSGKTTTETESKEYTFKAKGSPKVYKGLVSDSDS